MSVDVASLVFEIDSRQADPAAARLDTLIAKGEQLDKVARKVRSATDRMNEGHQGAVGIAQRAAQGAMALAAAEGAVEKATRGAATASASTRAARALEAAAMRELSLAARAYERDQMKTKAAVDALRLSVDPLRAAIARTNVEIAEANRLHSLGAIDAREHAQAIGALNARIATLDSVQGRGAVSSKKLTLAGLDLSRQLADIGVTAAMGMNPLMILIQQGPQIADRLALMRMEGLSLSTVLSSMGASILPLLPLIVGIGVAVGGAAAAFGLFERAVDKQTKYATTWGDTWNAVVHVVGEAIMNGPVGEALKWLGDEWNRTHDLITKGAFEGFTRLTAFISASYKTIVANWQNLPGAFEAIFVAAANAGMKAMSWFVNGNIKLLNQLIEGWNSLGPLKMPKVPEIDFNGLMLKPGQRAAKASADLRKFYESDLKTIQAAGRNFLSEIADQADREYLARQKATKGAREHAEALSEAAKAYERARKEVEEFVAAMEREQATAGMSAAQVKIMDAQAMAAKAIDVGYTGAAAAILRYVDALIQAEGMQKSAANDNVAFVRTPADLADMAERIGPKVSAQFEKMADAAREISYAIDDVKYSLKSGDWTSAANGMVRAFNSIKASFDKSQGGGTAQGIGAAASAAGQIVGGRAGGVLSGVGAGVTLGATIGSVVPVIGTAVGAVVGGILGGIAGLFGGGKAKKKEQQEAAERARQAEADRQARILAESRNQEILLLQLSDKSVEALALQRKYELEGMAEENRLRQQAIYDLQDKIEAEAKAAAEADRLKAFADERRQIDIALMEATGNAEGALDARRKDQLATLHESNREAQKAVWAAEDLAIAQAKLTEALEEAKRVQDQAREDARKAANDALADAKGVVEDARGKLTEAYNREASAMQNTTDKFDGFASSLAAFRRQLFTGDAAMNNPAAQYAATAAEFRRLSALPANSEERMGSIQSVAEAFLAASQAIAPDTRAYSRDLMEVRRVVADTEKSAKTEADVARQQLAALDASVAGLITINGSVLSVRDAIVGLQGAIGALGTAQGRADLLDPSKPATSTFADYVRGNNDILAAYDAYGRARGQTMEEFGKQQWMSTGFNEGRSVIPGFAHGGAFEVGGLGGTDSQHVQFMASPDEQVTIRTPAQRQTEAELVAEVRSLRQEMTGLRTAAEAMARTNKSMDDRGRLESIQGLYVRGETPGDPVKTDEAA